MSGSALVPGGRRVDLHAHTTFSDGMLTPEALAAGAAIELVPGIEMSTALEGAELHILGFYVNPEHAGLRERLQAFQQERRDRALSIIERLRELGAPVDADLVMELAGPGVIGRPHVAAAMVKAGLVSDLDDAFDRYLGSQAPAFVPRPAFTPAEAIGLIHAADGVSVLAHPGSQMPDSLIERLSASGLRGIEVWHPQHGNSTVRRYHALAARLHLLETGGSDFHGEHRNVDLGDLPVPVTVLDPLKQAAGVTG
jgi:predicted metal-dependent phosphoesterase TrpH